MAGRDYGVDICDLEVAIKFDVDEEDVKEIMIEFLLAIPKAMAAQRTVKMAEKDFSQVLATAAMIAKANLKRKKGKDYPAPLLAEIVCEYDKAFRKLTQVEKNN